MSFFDKAEDAFDDIKDKITGESDAEDAVRDAGSGASGTFHRAGDAAEDLGDQAGYRADDLGDRAGDAVGDTTDAGGGFLEDAGDTAARGIDAAGDWTDSATGGRFNEQIDSAENAAEGFVDEDDSAGTREA